VFADKETAAAIVDHVDANPLELDGHQLIVRHYLEPPHHVPKGNVSFSSSTHSNVKVNKKTVKMT